MDAERVQDPLSHAVETLSKDFLKLGEIVKSTVEDYTSATKMARELLEESSSDSEAGGIELKVNSDFAKRFEYNKKREELAKLEEKHGKSNLKRKRQNDEADSDNGSEDDSSDSEDEDDAGELATTALDGEIMATLNAIRSKDPRVYDGKTSFYSSIEPGQTAPKEEKEKALYLRDYHRENLLSGALPVEDEEPISYNQEQENLKQEIIGAMHAAADDSDDESDEELLVAKKRERPAPEVRLDVENADKDPETFLSNFMSARAWVPTPKSTYQPFESDDEEDEKRAEQYEEAYNMRFEDPAKSNERLRTHARDMAARYSVRRDEKNPRQKKRDEEKEQKEIEKQQRREEKARLRKLRIEQVEEKVKKIKQAAGLKSKDLQPEDWAKFVDDDWDDKKWEHEMQRRFGDDYYAEQEVLSDDEDRPRKKPRKPEFEDDLDINDLIPDFKEDDQANFSLSEDEQKTEKKNHKKIKEEKKKESKKERRIIEQLVDDQLRLELDTSQPGSSKTAGFRYRETSPVNFGLTSRDILLADDTQLNQFAGLKKLASYRDEERKRKDKKHLGKKARLRQWRKDTFGDEDGVQDKELVPTNTSGTVDENDQEGDIDIRTSGKKKRRRSKKAKAA